MQYACETVVRLYKNILVIVRYNSVPVKVNKGSYKLNLTTCNHVIL